MNSINFIFINGKGSSGKDTQADLLKSNLGDTAIRISTGDLYRDAKENRGEYARFHEYLAPFIEKVDSGGYIPDEVIVGIVKEVIDEKISQGNEIFIFTGFPRTEGQLTLVDRMVSSFSDVSSQHILFDISDETSKERAKNRREKALEAGLQIRPDDKTEVVEKRLKTYNELTFPMLEKLLKEERLIVLNAEGGIKDVERETTYRLSKER